MPQFALWCCLMLLGRSAAKLSAGPWTNATRLGTQGTHYSSSYSATNALPSWSTLQTPTTGTLQTPTTGTLQTPTTGTLQTPTAGISLEPPHTTPTPSLRPTPCSGTTSCNPVYAELLHATSSSQTTSLMILSSIFAVAFGISGMVFVAKHSRQQPHPSSHGEDLGESDRLPPSWLRRNTAVETPTITASYPYVRNTARILERFSAVDIQSSSGELVTEDEHSANTYPFDSPYEENWLRGVPILPEIEIGPDLCDFAEFN